MTPARQATHHNIPVPGLVPGIHVLKLRRHEEYEANEAHRSLRDLRVFVVNLSREKTWMPGTRPGTGSEVQGRLE
jgi:hypothetical protein